MDYLDGIWNSTKHLWEITMGVLSAVFSYVVYRAKKSKDDAESDRHMLYDHDVKIQIFDEKFKNLDIDITEIKDYLKKILFKL